MRLGLSGAAEYDNNVFRTDVQKKDDFVFYITPKVWLIEDEGKFHWDLGYRAPYEKAIQTERVDGFRHFLNADASYFWRERTRIFFTDGFSYSDSVNRFTTIDDTGGPPTVGTFREPVIRNSATLGVQHSFTPRLAGNLAFTHRLFETDLPSRSDNMVYVGNTNLQYMLDSRHRLGGGAALTFQDLEAANNGRTPPTQTLFFNMYVSWTWALTETTNFSITGGPTYVDTQYDPPPVVISGQPLVPFFEDPGTGRVYVNNLSDCVDQIVPPGGLCPTDNPWYLDPGDPDNADDIDSIRAVSSSATLSSIDDPSSGSSTWTFFGEVSLSKRWTPELASSLIYRRTESTASGTGSATLDLVSFVTTWQISELWKLQVLGDFTHRESVTPRQEYLLTVDDGTTNGTIVWQSSFPAGFAPAYAAAFTARTVERALDTDRWSVGLRMERRLTKHIRASLRYRYNEQSSEWRTAGSASDFSNHLVTLGVQYDFDRWHLW